MIIINGVKCFTIEDVNAQITDLTDSQKLSVQNDFNGIPNTPNSSKPVLPPTLTELQASYYLKTIKERKIYAEDLLERLKQKNMTDGINAFTRDVDAFSNASIAYSFMGVTFIQDIMNMAVSGDIEIACLTLQNAVPDDMTQPFHWWSAERINWLVNDMKKLFGLVMTVRFLFANPTTWYKKLGASLLQIGELVPFGHTAIELETYGQPKVYEFVFPKSKKSNRSEWNKHYEVVKEYQWQVPEHLQSKVYEYLEKQVGIRYAVEQIVFIGLTIIFGWLNLIFNKLVLNGNKAMVCTELGSRFAERFWGFVPTESHDKIGLQDMEVLSLRYENNVKWQSRFEE